MTNSFDSQVAMLVGVNAAVLYQNILYWVTKNAANGVHFHDGQYWTYNSNEAFQQLFPYMTSEQIRYALNKLVESGLVIKGHHSDGMNRTLWFAIGKNPKLIWENSHSNLGKFPNEYRYKPDINTDIYDNCARAQNNNIDGFYGLEPFGQKRVVFLSEAQVSDLLDKLGLEEFDLYIKKLEDFIFKHPDAGTNIHSHYDTILKWVTEDRAVKT